MQAPTVVEARCAALMDRAPAIIVATCDAGGAPFLTRALGSRLSADRRELTVFVSRLDAETALRQIAGHGAISVVFCELPSHTTVQYKGAGARVSPLQEGDLAIAGRYMDAYAGNVHALGTDYRTVRMALEDNARELVCVTFTPTHAFNQAPGPNAGLAMETAA